MRNPWSPLVTHHSDAELDRALEIYTDDNDLHVIALRNEKKLRVARANAPAPTPSQSLVVSSSVDESEQEIPDSELPWSTTEKIVVKGSQPNIRQSSATVLLVSEPFADDTNDDTTE